MRCLGCNCVLTDFEATRKTVNTNEFVDLCNKCFRPIAKEVPVIERRDLDTNNGDDDNEEELETYW